MVACCMISKVHSSHCKAAQKTAQEILVTCAEATFQFNSLLAHVLSLSNAILEEAVIGRCAVIVQQPKLLQSSLLHTMEATWLMHSPLQSVQCMKSWSAVEVRVAYLVKLKAGNTLKSLLKESQCCIQRLFLT